jgi:hypothetical protein
VLGQHTRICFKFQLIAAVAWITSFHRSIRTTRRRIVDLLKLARDALGLLRVPQLAHHLSALGWTWPTRCKLRWRERLKDQANRHIDCSFGHGHKSRKPRGQLPRTHNQPHNLDQTYLQRAYCLYQSTNLKTPQCRLGVFLYARERFTPRWILSDCLKTWVVTSFSTCENRTQ